jgi:hypothetical protein
MPLRLAIAAGLSLLALSAQATGMRCNPDLVEVGDTVADLLRMCGTPLVRSGVPPEDVSGPTRAIEQWTYSVGPGTLVRVVTISNGRILSVEDSDPPAAQAD